MTSRPTKFAFYIFAVVLAIRLYALWRLTASPFLLPSRGDMHFYDDWAQRILNGQLTDHLAFYGLPLYAYLLAFLYKIFGYNPFIPELLQAVLDAGTAMLIYKIATRVFNVGVRLPELDPAPGARSSQNASRIIGGLAALGWAFFVPTQAYSVILMPTAWLIFVFWFLIWQAVRRDTAPGKVPSFLFGLLIGVTATGIATILFVVPLLIAAIVLRPVNSAGHERIHRFGAKFAAILLLFLGVGMGVSPCWLHNTFVAHDRVALSAHSGVNFWIGNNPTANGYPRFPPGLGAGQTAMLQDSIAVAEAAAGRPLKRSEVSGYWSAKARAYVTDNPAAWLRLLWVKIANFWNAFQYDDLSIITSLRAEGVILPGPSFGIVAALALPGMILGAVCVPASRWILAAVLLHMISLLSVFVTERYRLAAVPGLLLFGAFALWKLWEFCTSNRYVQAAGLAGAIAVTSWFVSLPQRDPALWALEAYNSGWQALESGNLPLAEKKLTLAYAYVPGNTEINLALGNLWQERGESGKAEQYYLATLRIDPRHKSALSNLAVLALGRQQSQHAAELLRAALEVAPDDPKTHYLLARAEFDLGHLGTAMSEIETAIRLNPKQPEFVKFREDIRLEMSAQPR